MHIKVYLFLTLTLILSSFKRTEAQNVAVKASVSKKSVTLKNPIIPGYFADPSIVQHDGKFYLYATLDPWGDKILSCWVSDNFKDWKFEELNWPTKLACTSPTSNGNMVWAPSVVKKGKMFYMYVSVGSEVWCGISEHPLGPWKNMLGDKPLIPVENGSPVHTIDAEVFTDNDGRSYLYWGSGFNWTNGHCMVAELNPDMHSFKTKKQDITPANYFEGPFMNKIGDKYYLSYSQGITADDTYEVRYAVGDSPIGPFTEAPNSPILKTDTAKKVFGPGHHTIFTYEGKHYILYHRHSLPFKTGTAMRQICIDEIKFDEAKSEIKPINFASALNFPTHAKVRKARIFPSSVKSDSEREKFRSANNVLDGSFGTFWEAKERDTNPSITATFNNKTKPTAMDILLEYAWKTYYFEVIGSNDGKNWKTVADFTQKGISGLPISVKLNAKYKFIKLKFNKKENVNPGIWEWYFY